MTTGLDTARPSPIGLFIAVLWDCLTNPRLILVALIAFAIGCLGVVAWDNAHPPYVPTTAERIMSRLNADYVPPPRGVRRSAIPLAASTTAAECRQTARQAPASADAGTQACKGRPETGGLAFGRIWPILWLYGICRHKDRRKQYVVALATSLLLRSLAAVQQRSISRRVTR